VEAMKVVQPKLEERLLALPTTASSGVPVSARSCARFTVLEKWRRLRILEEKQAAGQNAL
jgi:hypothetical protein